MISASMVKELRNSTGAGMMDCKKALVEADGDMPKPGNSHCARQSQFHNSLP